jgi:molecular chaperone HtpG
MQKIFAKDAKNARLNEYTDLLYDQALLTAGLPIPDPLAFANRVSSLMSSEAESLA